MIFMFLVRVTQDVALFFLFQFILDYVPALTARLVRKYKDDPNYATTLPIIRNFKGIGVGDGYFPLILIIIIVGQTL